MCVCPDINESGINCKLPLHTETCNLACTDPLMNPDCVSKTRSVWPILQESKSPAEKKWTGVGIFKPAEPHSPWDVCSLSLSLSTVRLSETRTKRTVQKKVTNGFPPRTYQTRSTVTRTVTGAFDSWRRRSCTAWDIVVLWSSTVHQAVDGRRWRPLSVTSVGRGCRRHTLL